MNLLKNWRGNADTPLLKMLRNFNNSKIYEPRIQPGIIPV
jgi:hypothetical protein